MSILTGNPTASPTPDANPPHRTCPLCGVTTPVDVAPAPSAPFCPRCRLAHVWLCPGCGGWNVVPTLCAAPDPADALAGTYDAGDDEDEQDDENEDDGYFGYVDETVIHDYGYKPWPDFRGTGPLYLGLELEIATPPGDRYDCARTASNWLGDLGYLKSDASIDHGFEIVTHPMSYPWAIQHFPWRMLPDLADLGCAATRQTGLHVHLSRAGFDNSLHVYRWLKFVYRNQPAVTALARRSDSQWAQFSDEPRRAVKDHAKGLVGGSRYWAINTSNSATFELRVFASSLHPIQVQAALGFAAASVEYTRALTVPALVAGGWSWPAFTTWLSAQPGYPSLRAQVEALTCAC